MRAWLLLLTVLLVPALPLPAQDTPAVPAYKPLTLQEKSKVYLRRAYGPLALARTGFSAGILQARGYPDEWGGGMEGFGRRFGSKFGEQAIVNTAAFAFGAAFGEDPRYFKSRDKGFGPRFGHAVVSTFVVRNDSGGRQPALGRLIGIVSSQFVANTWYPDRYNDPTHALQRAGFGVGVNIGLNVAREFWPGFKRLRGR